MRRGDLVGVDQPAEQLVLSELGGRDVAVERGGRARASRCRCRAGRHGDRGHAGADQVGGEPLHEADDGVLGGVVGREVEEPVGPGRRGDGDEPAARRVRAGEHAPAPLTAAVFQTPSDVDVPEQVELLVGRLPQRPATAMTTRPRRPRRRAGPNAAPRPRPHRSSAARSRTSATYATRASYGSATASRSARVGIAYGLAPRPAHQSTATHGVPVARRGGEPSPRRSRRRRR